MPLRDCESLTKAYDEAVTTRDRFARDLEAGAQLQKPQECAVTPRDLERVNAQTKALNAQVVF